MVFLQKQVLYKDLSMENNPVHFSSNLGLIMSAGFAEGNILLLNETDIDFLDELGENLNVSVISRSEKKMSSQLKNTITRIMMLSIAYRKSQVLL